MDAASVFIGRALLEGIALRREEMLRPLLNGAATDFANYKNRVGYLKALTDIEDMLNVASAAEDRRIYGAFGPNDNRPQTRPG